VTIKPSTRHYWKQVFVALLKSWPGLADREIRRITKTDCKEWARRFRKAASPTRYNNTIAGLRHVFDVAIEAGIINGNPAAKLERVPVRQKQLTLPVPPFEDNDFDRRTLGQHGVHFTLARRIP
jgi:hypothetical protein